MNPVIKARLSGNPGSPEYLAQVFVADPAVVLDETGHYLWSASIDNAIVDGRPVHWDVAQAVLMKINGIGRLMNPGFVPVVLTGVYDGYTGGAVARISGIRAMVYTPDVDPSHAGAYLARTSDELIALVIDYLGSESFTRNWFEAYDVYELIRDDVTPTALNKWIVPTDQKRFTTSANTRRPGYSRTRHAKIDSNVQVEWLSLHEGVRLVRELAVTWLAHRDEPGVRKAAG